MTTLKWTLSLKDSMSGAAKSARRSMEGLHRSMRGVDLAGSKIGQGMGRSMSKSLSKLDLGRVGNSFSVAGAAAGAALGNAALQAGQMALSKGWDAGNRIFDGAGARESFDLGMNAILGSTKKASAVFERIKGEASELGLPLLKTMQQAQGLMASGFKLEGETSVFRMIEGAKALKFIKPTANIDQVMLALSQIQAKGRLTAEELNQQLGESVNVGDVLSELGKKYNKTNNEVLDMMKKGQVKAADGINAVWKSVEKTGGKSIRELAKAGATSFESTKERFASLFEDLGASKQFKGPLQTVNDLMNSVMKGIGKVDLTKMFDNMARGAKSVFSILGKAFNMGALDNTSGGMADFLERLDKMKVGETMGATFEAIGKGIKGFGEGLGVLDKDGGLDPEKIRQSGRDLEKVGNTFGKIMGYAIKIGTWLDRAGGLFGEGPLKILSESLEGVSKAYTKLESIVNGSKIQWPTLPSLDINSWTAGHAAPFAGAGGILGAALVGGIKAGILGGKAGVSTAISGVATTGLVVAQRENQVQSPSKRFERELGIPIGGGVVSGIYKQIPAAREALSGLVSGARTSVAQDARISVRNVGMAAGQSLVSQRSSTSSDRSGGRSLDVSGGIHVQVIDQQIIADGTIELLRAALYA